MTIKPLLIKVLLLNILLLNGLFAQDEKSIVLSEAELESIVEVIVKQRKQLLRNDQQMQVESRVAATSKTVARTSENELQDYKLNEIRRELIQINARLDRLGIGNDVVVFQPKQQQPQYQPPIQKQEKESNELLVQQLRQLENKLNEAESSKDYAAINNLLKQQNDLLLERLIDLSRAQRTRPQEQTPEVITETIEVSKPIALSKAPNVEVFFESGRHTLSASEKLKLHQVIDFLKQHSSLNAVLTGKADRTGSSQTNLLISKRRAEHVKDYLVENGINPSRIQTRAVGFENSERANPLDRKVVITFN